MKKTLTRREILKMGAMTGAVAAAGTVAAAGKAFAKPEKKKAKFNWRMQCHWPIGVEYYKHNYVCFCDAVREATDGELDIKPFPPDSIVPTKDTLEAVGNGLFEINWCWPAYWQGKMPVASLACGHTFVWDNLSQMYWNTYMQNAMEYYRAAYAEHNVHLVGFLGVDGITLWSKKPITTVNDFKGLKVRSTGTPADTMKKAGATPVYFPGSELYQALQTGVCEAAHWGGIYTGAEMKFAEVTGYIVQPDLARVSNAEIFVNKQKWDQLPDDFKKIINECTMSNNYDLYSFCDFRSKTILKEVVDSKKVQVSMIEPASVKQLKAYSTEVLDEYAKKDPKYCGPVVKTYKAMFDLI